MPDDPADALRPNGPVGDAASPVRVLWLVKGMARGGAETLLLLEARVRDRDQIRVSVVGDIFSGHRTSMPELEAMMFATKREMSLEYFMLKTDQGKQKKIPL